MPESLLSQPPAIPDAASARLSILAWAGSEAILDDLLKQLEPGPAATRFGLHLLRENQAGDAATVFRAAIALSPGDPDLWTNLGVALDRAGNATEAAGALERSLELRHGQPDLWVFLGVIRAKLGDTHGAEQAHRNALALDPNSSSAWQCLALLQEARRDFPAAIDSLRHALQRLPSGPPTLEAAPLWANLGKLLYQLGRVHEARDAYAQAAAGDAKNEHYPRMKEKAQFLAGAIDGANVDDALAAFAEDPNERLEWLEVAAGVLIGLGHRDAGLSLSRKRVELSPDSTSAKYLLDALTGEPLDRAPAGYIEESFDAFAVRYDSQLVSVLGYDVPEQLTKLISESAPGQRFDTLDAGCGTGLCGPLLRPLSRTLTGVDLSARMIEQAERRGVYDRLQRAELIDFLSSSDAAWDLLVAADVLLYFGELAPLFAGAARALKPGGLYCFSTEVHADSIAEGYRVQPSGRFSHSARYVRACASAAFSEVKMIESTLRADPSGRVRGNLYLFRKN